MPGPHRVVVLGSPSGWHSRRLLETLKQRGHTATVLTWEVLGADLGAIGSDAGERFFPEELADADAVIVRGMPAGPLETVIVRMDLLDRLSCSGRLVLNSPRALEVAIDKYLSAARLRAAGLPIPPSAIVQNPGDLRRVWQKLGGDCVFKPLFGSNGRGLERLIDEPGIQRLATGLPLWGGVAFLQTFIPHEGWDIRVLVVGEKLFAMRRWAAAGEWRTNLACGGRPEPLTLPSAWADLAKEAATVVGSEIAGVDLLQGRDGRLWVLEVNAVPGWRGLQSTTHHDLASVVVQHVENRLA